MKRVRTQAFTLVELLVVITIILALVGLVIGVANHASQQQYKSRIMGEIQAMGNAIVAYQVDNKTVPRSDDTDLLDPRKNGNPATDIFKTSSLFLYQQLSGDEDADGKAGDNSNRVYYQFKPIMLGGFVQGDPKAKVKYLADEYGLAFGYSTAGAKAEADYRELARTSTSPPVRSADKAAGFGVEYDLWSTAGQTQDPPTDAVRLKWYRSW